MKARQSPDGMHVEIYMSAYILDVALVWQEFLGF